MRTSVLAGLGLVTVLAVPAAAAGTPGPFAGQVKQGQTKTHLYDNNPAHQACPAITATYRVALTYAPASDVLTLSAGTKTATGSNGAAALTLVQGTCASFTVKVAGTSVADTATYVVTVTRDSGAIG